MKKKWINKENGSWWLIEDKWDLGNPTSVGTPWMRSQIIHEVISEKEYFKRKLKEYE